MNGVPAEVEIEQRIQDEAQDPWNTAQGFLEERADFLSVQVVSGEGGYDVVLRVDGTYDSRESAEQMAEYVRDGIRPLLDEVDHRLHWWNGCPWVKS